MKLIITLAALIAVAAAAAVAPAEKANILKYDSENIGVDGYKFDVETSDGLKRSEEGVLINPGTDSESLAVRGSISWIDLEGKPHSLTFIADDNGFQPISDDIPK